jgi:signal peptidase I
MRRMVALAGVAVVTSACGSSETTLRFRVPSSSMEPTLHCARPAPGCEARTRDFVLVHAYGGRRPRRRDIVVFRTPPRAQKACGIGGIFIKRIVGLPGERWAERTGYLYVDGVRLDEPYVDAGRRDNETFAGGRIARGRFLLLGDNRAQSRDSRVYGLVPRRNLVGRVFQVERGSKQIDIR